MRTLLFFVLIGTPSVYLFAQRGKSCADAIAQKYPALPDSVERKAVTVWSDGTKMVA